jgi:DNA-binding winged helix-turn-helix (wHTH) protein
MYEWVLDAACGHGSPPLSGLNGPRAGTPAPAEKALRNISWETHVSSGSTEVDRSTSARDLVDGTRMASKTVIGIQARFDNHDASHRATDDPTSAPAMAWRVAFDGCAVDMIDRRLRSRNERVLRLAGLEFDLLRIFVAQPRLALSRSQLSKALAKAGHAQLSPRTVDSYVCRLRRRLGACGAHVIRTVRGLGYAFEADVKVY